MNNYNDIFQYQFSPEESKIMLEAKNILLQDIEKRAKQKINNTLKIISACIILPFIWVPFMNLIIGSIMLILLGIIVFLVWMMKDEWDIEPYKRDIKENLNEYEKFLLKFINYD